METITTDEEVMKRAHEIIGDDPSMPKCSSQTKNPGNNNFGNCEICCTNSPHLLPGETLSADMEERGVIIDGTSRQIHNCVGESGCKFVEGGENPPLLCRAAPILGVTEVGGHLIATKVPKPKKKKSQGHCPKKSPSSFNVAVRRVIAHLKEFGIWQDFNLKNLKLSGIDLGYSSKKEEV